MEKDTTEECSICLQTFVQPAQLPCGHIFCFLCIKGISEKSRRCALCRNEILPEFLNNPKIIAETLDPIEEPLYVWYYEGRNGWWQYDERTTRELEDAYSNHNKQCSVLIAGNLYLIDFLLLHQYRINDPSKYRRVKRDLASRPKKGIGGIRNKTEYDFYPESLSYSVAKLTL